MATKKAQFSQQPKTMKYIDLISRTPNAQEQLSNMNEDASLQLQSDILATRRALASYQASLKTAKSAVPYNTGNIMDAMQLVEGTERGLIKLEELKKELF